MAPLLIGGGLLFLGATGVASWMGHVLVLKIAEVQAFDPGYSLPLGIRAYSVSEPTLEWTLPIAFPMVSLLLLFCREMPFRAVMIYIGTAFMLCTLWCGWTLIAALIMHGVLKQLTAAGG
jgi:Ca2+/Na+ antiporter